MRAFIVGLLVGFILAPFLLGAVTTFSQISGRGTYAAGYLVLPRCQSDLSTLEAGSVCWNPADGKVMVKATAVEAF